MREGMAADHMSFFSQAANLIPAQEALFADLTGRDKEMSTPPILLEKVRDAVGRSLPAVVEGQKKRKRPTIPISISEFICTARWSASNLCDSRKMGFEFGPGDFLFRRSRTSETTRIPIRIFDYIVIKQAGGSQRAPLRASDFYLRYLVNQGCPHVADGRPGVFDR